MATANGTMSSTASTLFAYRLLPGNMPPGVAGAPTGACDDGVEKALAALPRLKWLQRVGGFGIAGAEKIARLLLLYREAFREESSGRFVRANFFWQVLYQQLERDWTDFSAWDAAAQLLSSKLELAAMEGEALRRYFASEFLFQTHYAFFLLRQQSQAAMSASDRAFFHVQNLNRISDAGGCEDPESRSMLVEANEAHIEALRKGTGLQAAVRACSDLLRRVPETPGLAERLAWLHFDLATSVLSDEDTQEASAQDAARLRVAVKDFESARQEHPDELAFYLALARCQQVLAVKLANGGHLADALAAARLSQKYDPFFEEAFRAEEKLTGMMKDLQAHAKEVQTQLSQQPGMSLNDAGQRLLQEAIRGFRPLNETEDSALAVQLPKDFHRAHARAVWLQVGLPVPPQHWDEKAAALHEALSAVSEQPPASSEDLEVAWRALAENSEELRSLDAVKVTAFLRKRLFGDGEEPSSGTDTVGRTPVPDLLPLVKQASEQSGNEPWDYWLFGRNDLPLKAGAVGSVAALIVCGALAANEWQERQYRDSAYQALMRAVVAADDGAVLSAAERYLSLPRSANDAREEEVRKRYDKAFAHWFTTNGHALDPVARARVERYRQVQMR